MALLTIKEAKQLRKGDLILLGDRGFSRVVETRHEPDHCNDYKEGFKVVLTVDPEYLGWSKYNLEPDRLLAVVNYPIEWGMVN